MDLCRELAIRSGSIIFHTDGFAYSHLDFAPPDTPIAFGQDPSAAVNGYRNDGHLGLDRKQKSSAFER